MANITTVTINLDTGKAETDLKKFQGQTEKVSKQIGKGIEENVSKNLSSGFKSLALTASKAGAALAAAFGASVVLGVKAANRQEDAVNNLNASLRRIGEFTPQVSRDMQNFATSLQNTTRFGDEAILKNLALAQSFGATAEQSKEVVQAATELSAAMGIDLESATRKVVKTFGGMASELGEVNPKVRELTREQLKNGEAAKVLLDQYKGLAAAQTETAAGLQDQLINSLRNLTEAFGALFTKNPLFVEFLKGAKNLVTELIQIINNNAENIIRFSISAFVRLIEWVSFAEKAFVSLAKTIGDTFGITSFIKDLALLETTGVSVVMTLNDVFGRLFVGISSSVGVFVNGFLTGFHTIRVGALNLLSALSSVSGKLGIDLGIDAFIEKQLSDANKKVDEFVLKTNDSMSNLFNPETFAVAGSLTNELGLIIDSLKAKIINEETGETFFDKMFSSINEETLQEKVALLASFAKGAGKEFDNIEKTVRVKTIEIGRLLKDTFVNTTSAVFQKFGESLAGASVGMDAFVGIILNALGDLAISMGTTIVAASLAIDALKASIAGSGLAGVVLGGALIAVGAALKTFAGTFGGGSAPSLTGGAGGGGFASDPGVGVVPETPQPAEGLDDPIEEERRKQTNVQVIVQGDILDNGEETARRIANLLSDNFDSQDLFIKGRS